MSSVNSNCSQITEQTHPLGGTQAVTTFTATLLRASTVQWETTGPRAPPAQPAPRLPMAPTKTPLGVSQAGLHLPLLPVLPAITEHHVCATGANQEESGHRRGVRQAEPEDGAHTTSRPRVLPAMKPQNQPLSRPIDPRGHTQV